MREYSTPLTVEIPAAGSLTDDVVKHAEDHPDRVVFGKRTPEGWEDVTSGAFLTEVRAVARGLLARGVAAGDRVAILSRTRYEWTLLDYAIWYVGAVTVPIYETSSEEQIAWILEDSQPALVVVEAPAHHAKVSSVSGQHGPTVLCLDHGAVSELMAQGREIADDVIESRRSAVTPASPATIIYTSGTTGRPLGCLLTHGNFQFEVTVAVEELHELFEDEGASTLLFLPLAHVFARVIQVGAVKAGVRLGYSPDARHVAADLASFQPTFVLTVPRILERLFNTASQTATADGRGRVFERAATTAIRYSQSLDTGGPGPLLRMQHALFDRLVYARIRSALGGRCRYTVSGGAPLGERLGHFYRGIGLVVLEGYGLTETTAALTVNVPATSKIGTVGRPLPGTTVRVADDGELVVRGGQVLSGYWRNDAATEAAVSPEGWLHTGDLGEIDDEGFVRVTGRKKEILITAGGKNVAPAALEDSLRAHPLVSQCMVVGDGQPFIAALVTLDRDSVSWWAEQNGKPASISKLIRDPQLLAEIQAGVDEANKRVSQAEAIRKFKILAVDWTEESGELTPSLKLRRTVVMQRFRDDVLDLYTA